MKLSLNDIYPLIVPASYYAKGTWDLPHYDLSNSSFILTWVVLADGATMSYLTQEQYQELTANQRGWQRLSFENLRKSISDKENFFTQYQTSSDGKRLVMLAFMNSDGIGSSRILLSHELAKAFPNGYFLAFPDRSCGLVIAKDITGKELNDTTKLVKKMCKGATTPMSDKLHVPDEFLLPVEWIQPIDLDFSNLLTNEILKLRASF